MPLVLHLHIRQSIISMLLMDLIKMMQLYIYTYIVQFELDGLYVIFARSGAPCPPLHGPQTTEVYQILPHLVHNNLVHLVLQLEHFYLIVHLLLVFQLEFYLILVVLLLEHILIVYHLLVLQLEYYLIVMVLLVVVVLLMEVVLLLVLFFLFQMNPCTNSLYQIQAMENLFLNHILEYFSFYNNHIKLLLFHNMYVHKKYSMFHLILSLNLDYQENNQAFR